MDANAMNNANRLIQSINESTTNTANVKYIKKDRGLLERKACEEKIILQEDNRQVLFD